MKDSQLDSGWPALLSSFYFATLWAHHLIVELQRPADSKPRSYFTIVRHLISHYGALNHLIQRRGR